MSDYGLLTQDGYEDQPDMPATITNGMPGQEEDPFKLIEVGLVKLNLRLKAAMAFVNKVATSPGPCRCSYVPDANCIICQAKRLIEGIRES